MSSAWKKQWQYCMGGLLTNAGNARQACTQPPHPGSRTHPCRHPPASTSSDPLHLMPCKSTQRLGCPPHICAHPCRHCFVHAHLTRQPALLRRAVGLHQIGDGVGPPAADQQTSWCMRRYVKLSQTPPPRGELIAMQRTQQDSTSKSSRTNTEKAPHPFMSVNPSTYSRQKGHFRPASACSAAVGSDTR